MFLGIGRSPWLYCQVTTGEESTVVTNLNQFTGSPSSRQSASSVDPVDARFTLGVRFRL
jgi:hypothetical protein